MKTTVGWMRKLAPHPEVHKRTSKARNFFNPNLWPLFSLLKRGRSEKCLDDLSNSSPAVRRYSEGRPTGPRTPLQDKGKIMTQYLVAIHHPDDYDPSTEDEAMERDIDALNDEMVAAGVRIFVGGLSPASSARALQAQPNGKVLITDGPYLETKEHIGGFWILEAADLDEALAWGRKAAVACRAPVEVREFIFRPPPPTAESK